MKSKMLITVVVGLLMTGSLTAGNTNPEKRGSERLKMAAVYHAAGDSVYTEVDKFPEPVGGLESIMKKIVYSEDAKKIGLEGKVFLSATIDESGNVIKADLMRFAGNLPEKAEYEKAVQSLVNSAISAINGTKFTPGEKAGKKVKVKVTLPIAFKLNGADKKKEAKLDKDVYEEADKMPEPVGGIEAILKRVVYPEDAKKNGIEGKVFLSTVIDESGNATDIKVIKGAGNGLDEAAVNALKGVKFTPGEVDGKKVKVKIVLPVMFKLK